MTVTNKNFDLSALDQRAAVGANVVESVTSTEQTLTVTPSPYRDVELELKASDQPWGINRATSAYAAKQTYAAGALCKLIIPRDAAMVAIVFYWIAASTTATVSVQAKN